MRKAIKVYMAATVAAVVSLIAGAGAASAATTGIPPRFAAQARAGGVSAAQADQLQQEVTNYIHKYGGSQVALNVVDFPGGSITFVVPGEKYARDLATQHHALVAAPACTYGEFCAFYGTFYSSTEKSWFNNCKYNNMSWYTEGSYINDLPTRGQAVWYDINYNVKYITPPAYSSNPEVNWTPVFYIRACY